MSDSPSRGPRTVDQKYRDNWGDIFGEKTVKSKKIDDGYGEKPYDELVETNKVSSTESK